MKKIVLALCALATLSFAQLVDGVAVLVNNLPITLLDIVKAAQIQKISNEKALEGLITVKLQEWTLEKRRISISDYEVTKQIEKIAAGNKMTLTQFQDALKAQYINYDSYKAEVKRDLERRKLFEQIAQESFTPFDDKSMQIFYETHKQSFSQPLKLDVVQYSSKNPKALEALQASPMSATPASVAKQDVKIDTASLDSQLVNMFKMAKSGSFTPIMPIKNEYITFYVKDVLEWTTPPFSEVKNQVFEQMAMLQQDEAIKEYFEKQKASAQIIVVRLP